MYQTSQGYNCAVCTDCGRGSGRTSNLEKLTLGSANYEAKSSRVSHYESQSGNNISYGASPVFNYGGGHKSQGGYGSFSQGSKINYSQVDSGSSFGIYQKTNQNQEVLDHFLRTRVNENYRFIPDDFLKPNRKRQKFVGKAEEIQSFAEEAFKEITGLDFPDDILVKICSPKELKKFALNPGVRGLSINRKEEGLVSEVFVLEDELDKVLLTLGHEIGHVLTNPLNDKRDEEAKAFAFSFAWMETIKEKNIAGLGGGIVLDQPAQNGLHDVAFGFVWKLINSGKKALEVYRDLVRKAMGVSRSF